MPLRDLFVLAFFLLSLPVCLVRPFYGILLWTVVAFLNPHRYAWGIAHDAHIAESIGIATLVGFLLFTRGWWNRLAVREVLLVVLIWIWFTITSALSASNPLFTHHAQDTWNHWELFSKILLMTLVTIALTNSFARLRTLVLVVAGCFGALVLKTVPFMILTGGAFRLYGPPDSMIADNNDFGLALNMTLPLFFFLAQTESNRWVKRLFGFLFVATIPAIFFTYSRGALVGLAVVLALMLLRVRQRLVLVPIVALALVIALLFAPAQWKQRMDPNQSLDNSALERLNAWSFSWRLALDFPIAGGGFDTFTPELFQRYAPNAGDLHGPHSIYFQLLAEHGFVGLFLYLAVVFSSFAALYRLARLARFFEDIKVINYANMFGFSMVGFLTSGLFLGRAYFDYFFTFIACIIILKKVAREEWAQNTEVALQTVAEPAREEIFLPYGGVAFRER